MNGKTMNSARKQWTTPSLTRLTVDLNAIAGNKAKNSDGPGLGKSTS